MSTFLSITNVLAFRHRVASVIEALKERGIDADAVRAEFLAAGDNKMAAQDTWERVNQLENPTAAELRLFARVLQVNTTWLITGDLRFVPELMATTCMCWPVPESMWTTYGSAVDPASTHEFNPDCPAHGPEVEVFTVEKLNLMFSSKAPESPSDLIPSAAGNTDQADSEF
ncbi:hypothetical protein WMO79_01270 [Micrococcaceae bacterium Sec7.4]